MIKQLILKDFIIQWKFLIWYILYPVFFYMALTDTEKFIHHYVSNYYNWGNSKNI